MPGNDKTESERNDIEQRRRTEDETNTTGSHRYSCATRFHHVMASCDGLDSLTKVCEHWYSPDSEIQGLAYWRQEVGSKNNRAGVVAAVGDFLSSKKRHPKEQRVRKPKMKTPNLWQAQQGND